MIYTSIRFNNDKVIFDRKEFIELLRFLIKQHNIIEYYLLEENGSYLMVDDTGQIFIFQVYDDNIVDYLSDIALEEGLSKSIVTDLKNRNKILFYFDMDNKELPDTKYWKNYLKSPQIIEIDHKKYYYYFEKYSLPISKSIIFNKFINDQI
ncbi:hypothetical protein SZ25_00580 [Candidatus Arcanobacter lacustris]|uniref:Uncharacterized protein n=1 Tax=Candidatus Arcanibacter lacustris TaxID=1607817 RepID=A0A0F5MQM6_9RICK|nr:hypothetical protein SZ25_00580 [Candidatus Arcanobacter lacustris]